MDARQHFLDGVRGVLALWVVFGHLSKLVGVPVPLLGNPAVAVDVFMLLSGYFIAATWARLREEQPPGRAAGFFLVRRVMRIWPVYALLLSLSWLLFEPLDAARLQLLRAFAPGDAATPLPAPDAVWALLHYSMLNGLVDTQAQRSHLPDWSLSLEFQFYLLFPLLAGLLARRPLWLCLVAAGLAFVSPRLLGDYLTPGSLAHFPQPALLSYRLNIFLLGVVAWRLFSAPRGEPCSLELLALVLCLAPLGAQQVLGVFAVLYLLSFPQGRAAALLGRGPMVWLGRISFTVYLVHLPLMRLIVAALLGVDGFATLPPALRLGLALACVLPPVLVLSQLLYRTVEAPGIRLAHRWTGLSPADHPKVAAAASPVRPPVQPAP